MEVSRRFLIALTVVCSAVFAADDPFLYGRFPDGFIWSTATSAYQIEGAWNADGKGENMWDRFSHEGGNVYNNDTGDVACDSYNKYLEDVQLMKALGVTYYRFSISWARIQPTGHGAVNQLGIAYYNRLIDALIAENIQPMVTLYHWDLPQALQDLGGFENESLVTYFEEYADICFRAFGDRVKLWLTFNEPFVVTWIGYGIGAHAPGIKDRPDTAPYTATHTIIKAHARAWHRYNDTHRATQKGRVSITLDSDWKEARDPTNQQDVDAAERAMQFKLGWYAHPIFVNGDYPQVMKDTVARKSREQGLNQSRLPEFTEEEKQMIKGTHDFFGLNHYTSQLMSHKVNPAIPASYEKDQDVEEYRDPSWDTSGTSWLRSVPWGIRRLLKFVKDNYNNPEVYITENGVSGKCLCLEDDDRIKYYTNYVNNVLKAIKLDGVNVKMYTAWSLLDNFEWDYGYSKRFGLYYVNFTDPNRPRTPKKSAAFYTQLVKDNGFPQPSGARATGGATLAVLLSLLGAWFM